MKSLILYDYPPEPGGLSMQGDMFYRGMKENGEEVRPCHRKAEFQKKWLYKYFEPDVAIGIGWWGDTPDIVLHPRRFGVVPVPWLLADGWVADYHEIIGNLPLVFVTSEWVKETYIRDGVDTKNFAVSHIGIEPELFRPIPKTDPKIEKIREILGILPNEKLILTIGGDTTSKGAQEVLRALTVVGKEFGEWKYVLKSWGHGRSRNHKKEEINLIKELGIDKRKILFLEGVFAWDFMPYILNAADIYAAPSRLEGFGMIQLEAQACGIPVISIDAMGPKETIIHGETGFLAGVSREVILESEIAPKQSRYMSGERIFFDKPKTFAYRANVEDLAEYLLILLIDDKKRVEMGKAAREHVVKNFHYRDIAKKMADLIKARLHLS